MQAKYPGTCGLCNNPIEIEDHIRRANGRHAAYAHAACVPQAGVSKRARYIVVPGTHPENWQAARKQYVHESMAKGYLKQLEFCGYVGSKIEEVA